MVQHTHIIVIGNEKGGSGKTTTALHLIMSLLKLGFSVTSIDIDPQCSLTNYIKNRRNTIINRNTHLPFPHHFVIKPSPYTNSNDSNQDESKRFLSAIEKASHSSDFIVIDTPGTDNYLSRLVHSYADTIITPVNDSFMDLDVLAKVENGELVIESPGRYSKMIWEVKLQKAKRCNGEIDWVVMRNRLLNINANNKKHVGTVLKKLGKRFGCRVVPGFSERVIFKELFLSGLTLLDVMEGNLDIKLNISHLAARRELYRFLEGLAIPHLQEKLCQSSTINNPKETVEETAMKLHPFVKSMLETMDSKIAFRYNLQPHYRKESS